MKYLFFLLICSILEATHPSIIKSEFIFNDPPFPSCHASTLTQTDSGSLLCACFGGTEEGALDVAIWLSNHDQEWSLPCKVAEEQDVPCWNPVLYTLPSKEVILFYKAGRNPEQWSGFIKRSHDHGKCWSEAELLPAGILGPIKNRPLLLPNGTMLCGSSIESWKRWGCWIDITTDNGLTWHKSTPINVPSQLFGMIQPALFFSKNGTIKLLARSHQIGSICAAESHDLGKTWSSAQPTSLPNPNAAIDAINLVDGRILLVYNHSKEYRSPLNIALSTDGGETWKMHVTLEDSRGEFSYPCVIQTKDGKIHVTYTWNRKNIKHVVLDPNLL